MRRFRELRATTVVSAISAAALLATLPGAAREGAPAAARPQGAGAAMAHKAPQAPQDYEETACEGSPPEEGDIYSRPPKTGPDSSPPGGRPQTSPSKAPDRPPRDRPPRDSGDSRDSFEEDRAATGAAAGSVAAYERPLPLKWPRNMPDRDEAVRMLAELDVKPFDSKGYDRKHFGAACWVQHGVDRCTTRQVALKLHSDVPATLDGPCRVVGGKWHSEYDNRTMADPVHVDLDHVVSLRNAWGSGARDWTPQKRLEFANDLTASPELIAVSTWTNRRKGDKSPDQWLPQLPEAQCKYGQAWVAVKDYYGLSVTAAEKAKLQEVLGKC
ncbi:MULTISPECIES: HNH endonuclease family protein [Streptomyces]|uniref:GmrSD restriction endonucleases C-terminal domain-containing protein n=1 Tax=Streptomyces luteosporeus TaxID=173856 RepID=A0ABN3TQN1_9ACTN